MSELPPAKRRRWTVDEPCTQMEHTQLPSPKIQVATSETVVADLTVIGLFGYATQVSFPKDQLAAIPVLAPDIVASLEVAASHFDRGFRKGEKVAATTPVVRTANGRYTLLGLGKEDTAAKKGIWGGGIGLKIGAILAQLVDLEKGCRTVLINFPGSLVTSHDFIRDFSQSFFHGLYSDNRYRTGDNKRFPCDALTHIYLGHIVDQDVFIDRTEFDALVAKATNEGRSLAHGQYFAMDIVNAPHNVLNSESLANEARNLALTTPGLSCTILDKHGCEQRGMGAYLGVARGSETEPQFIHMVYRSPQDGGGGAAAAAADHAVRKKLGVVGKGLLFDSGGYNIKTSMMEWMKFDCGGAAAVLGAARAIAALELQGVEVHFIIAACENMINEKAMVPSDILTASNGTTIEVNNTDAEGRLTLADALVYADTEVGCDSIIELSTLTGACMVSLGRQICGIWTNNDSLAVELDSASKATGEKAWRMPMAAEYNDQLDSIIADYKNCGTRYGGAITAALFLQKFVNPEKPFAHIDIAGPVWDDKKGATGFGVKLITEWVSKQG